MSDGRHLTAGDRVTGLALPLFSTPFFRICFCNVTSATTWFSFRLKLKGHVPDSNRDLLNTNCLQGPTESNQEQPSASYGGGCRVSRVAARFAALAGPGEVFVSSTTRDLLDGSGLSLEYGSEYGLKGPTGPPTVFALQR